MEASDERDVEDYGSGVISKLSNPGDKEIESGKVKNMPYERKKSLYKMLVQDTEFTPGYLN